MATLTSSRLALLAALAALVPCARLNADEFLSGSAQIDQALRRLANTGSVLMIAAHPDDENTALLAYFARGLSVRTGYLSMTRGEGGQNLLGPEQGDALGVIRTRNCWRRATSTGPNSSSRAPSTSDSRKPPTRRCRNGAATACSATWCA